jgi:hypothetical protein
MRGAKRARDLVVRRLSERLRSTKAKSRHVLKAFCRPSARRAKPSSVRDLLGTFRSSLWRVVSFESSSQSLRSLSLILSRSFRGVRVAEADNLNDNLGADDCDLLVSRCFLSARFSRSDAIDLPSFGPDDVRYMLPCQRVPRSSILCARRKTYTGVVEFVGFNHDFVVSFKTRKWCADVKVLSIHKLCAMKRGLVGVHVNNAATNKTWKPRHDHGTSRKLWNSLFLSLRTREVDLGRGTVLLCIAPAVTMLCELAPSSTRAT